jgi:hypothetical protein
MSSVNPDQSDCTDGLLVYNQIKDDSHSSLMNCRDEPITILHRTVLWVHTLVVRNIIALTSTLRVRFSECDGFSPTWLE